MAMLNRTKAGTKAGAQKGNKLGTKAAVGLVALLTFTGVMHFARPKLFDSIVPKALPGPPRNYTYASGVAELGIAGLVAHPKTRRLGGGLAALLFLAVFPANLQMAWDWRHASLAKRLLVFGRLPLQIPLVLWAAKVRRDASRQG